MNNRYLAAFVTISASAHMGACTALDPDDFDLARWESQLNAYESACLLDAVNDCNHDFDFYDKDLNWDRRAAEALIDFRNGNDSLCGTSDDALFTDFADVDTIPFVGPVAASNLLQYVGDSGCVDSPCSQPDKMIEDVRYTFNQESNLLNWANHAHPVEMQLLSGIGQAIAQRIEEYRAEHGSFQSIQEVANIKGIGPKRLEQLRHEIPAIWCPQEHAHCGCSRLVEGSVKRVIETVQVLLSQPKTDRIERFLILLGADGYHRFLGKALKKLTAQLWSKPPFGPNLPTPSALLAPYFSDQHFLNPFEFIETTAVQTDDLLSGLNAAVDATILHFNLLDLESTSIGVSFSDLVTGENEALYLEELRGWRGLDSTYVAVTELDHLWMFSGTMLGLQCEISVSRKTGHVLDVDIDIP